jgi:hypothetical protein
MHRKQRTLLFDHLIGDCEQSPADGQAERGQ